MQMKKYYLSSFVEWKSERKKNKPTVLEMYLTTSLKGVEEHVRT